jgi:hypothetical protein
MGRVIGYVDHVHFLEGFYEFDSQADKTATVVPEKQSTMNEPKSGSGTKYKNR